MKTFLFTWNPKKWSWITLDADAARCKAKKYIHERWSCGVTKYIAAGDRVFLIKLGSEEPTGIMASGTVLTAPFNGEHFTDSTKMAWYVDLRFDVLLHPYKEKILSRSDLLGKIPKVHWSPQASGTTIPPDAAVLLETLWSAHLARIGLSPLTYSEEVPTPERYWEGAVRRISVNAYERDPRARRACLQHHGICCSACGFNFESAYGKIGKGFIHVHHLRELSEIGEAYEVDPLTEMIPVCPNCHAMIHRQVPSPIQSTKLRKRIGKG